MKRVGYIYNGIHTIDNIKQAIMNASKGKRDQNRVKKIIENKDYCAVKISEMLKNKTYKPSPYVIKIIFCGSSNKERKIYKPRFYPDQIIHWALIQQIQPIIMRGMYYYTCGSIPNRGSDRGQKAIRKWLDKDCKNTKYCLKMDITKFYPSIDNNILKQMFRKKIKDKDCLWLIDTVIDSAKGLPIGNYTSQWFSNFLLEGLDHFIKEELKIKYYVRYVDDLVLLGANKKKMNEARKEIEKYLKNINLKLKGNWQVFRVNIRDIDFLGFRFFRNKTILRKRNALRIKRRMSKINKKKSLNYKDASAIISYWGWMKRCDSYNFYHEYVKTKISLKQARKVVSTYAKIRNYRKWRAENQKENLPRSKTCRV